MADLEWKTHKSELEKLYIQEGATLNTVMKHMSSKYSFNRSKQQYQRRFKSWNFKKSYPSSHFKWITKRVEKRKRQHGKESEVYIDGTRVPPDKISRIKYREGYLSAIEYNAPSPSTPDGVEVCTPIPPTIWASSTESSPLSRFSKATKFQQKQAPAQATHMSSDTNILSRWTPRNFFQISTFLLHNNVSHELTDTQYMVPSAMDLELLMQELHDQHAISLSSQNTDCEPLETALFLLSNKFVTSEHVTDPQGNAFNDDQVLQLFGISDWSYPSGMRSLLASSEPTAQAIAEQLFTSAVRLPDVDLLKAMLESGFDPNTKILDHWHIPQTCLSYTATHHKNAELLELLVSYGADVNLPILRDSCVLFNAIMGGDVCSIRVLLTHGARVTPQCLLSLAYGKPTSDAYYDLIQEILDACPDLKSTGIRSSPTHEYSANKTYRQHVSSPLASAIACRHYMLIDCLLARDVKVNDEIFSHDMTVFAYHSNLRHEFGHCIFTTVLGTALLNLTWAGEIKIDILQTLVNACVEINPEPVSEFLSPLAIAVEMDYYEAAQCLIEGGIDIVVADACGHSTLLQRAARRGNSNLCKFLMNNGARIEDPYLSMNNKSFLVVAIENKWADVVEILLKTGVGVNDELRGTPNSFLGVALETGDKMMIDLLSFHGATFIGMQMTRIPNLQAMSYLEGAGALSKVLQVSGHRILPSSVSLGLGTRFTLHLLHEYRQLFLRREIMPGAFFSTLDTMVFWAVKTRDHELRATLLQNGASVTDEALTVALEWRSDHFVLIGSLINECSVRAPITIACAIMSCIRDMREQVDTCWADRDLAPDPLSPEARKELYHGLHRLRISGMNPSGELRPSSSFPSKELYGEHFLKTMDRVKSVLGMAVDMGDIELFNMLIGWTPWTPQQTGHALALAILLGNDSMIDVLMNANPDLTQEAHVESSFKVSPFKVHARIVARHSIFTPLQAAVHRQMTPIVRRLAKLADVNYLGKGALRRTPLQIAVQDGSLEMIDILLEHGGRVDASPAEDGGATALQLAASKGYIGIARKLIELGANVNEARAKVNGRTALEGAAEFGRIDMLKMLLNNGVLISGARQEENYERAIALAKYNGHHAAVRLLKSFGLAILIDMLTWD